MMKHSLHSILDSLKILRNCKDFKYIVNHLTWERTKMSSLELSYKIYVDEFYREVISSFENG